MVGAKSFTEQRILGEVIAQHIEHRLGGQVSRRLSFESTRLINDALMLHEIDIYPEYSGTEVRVVIDEVPDKDPTIVLERVHRYLEQTHMVDWLIPLGIENPFAISIPGRIARQNKINTLEDAENYKPGWAMATVSEFEQRADGYASMMRNYRMPMRTAPSIQDPAFLYRPVEDNRADMVAGRLTDGLLATRDMVVLKDVRKAFAPNTACIAVRYDTLAAYPSLRAVLGELSGKFTTEVMRKLNSEVDENRRDPRVVAAGFLHSAGLQ
jgi:glycine betaine/choline ABC-type transport system substrate-binding protein